MSKSQSNQSTTIQIGDKQYETWDTKHTSDYHTLTLFDMDTGDNLEFRGKNLNAEAVKKDLQEYFENKKHIPSDLGSINVRSVLRLKNNPSFEGVEEIELKSSENARLDHKHVFEKNPQQKTDTLSLEQQLKTAEKIGYVQGVCECVAAVGGNRILGKKLLAEMKVDKEMAKKYAHPETYKTLEQGIFAQKQEHKLEQTQGIKR